MNHKRTILLSIFLTSRMVDGHSWADIVGGGSFRGAQAISDLDKQRYFCPLSSLGECQPPNKTGVVLTRDSMRPCRTDLLTSVWGNAVSGRSIYIHWAGNGHTGNRSEGTCVSVSIAPYALDPDPSSFVPLATCLPFSYGADQTDANVTIPSHLPSGNFTIFWLWDFKPFWFSSCSDIRVTNSYSTFTTAMPPLTTSAILSRNGIETLPSTASYESRGCALLNNEFCKSRFGEASYCKTWSVDRCGRSSCFGGDFESTRCVDDQGTSTASSSVRTPTSSTTKTNFGTSKPLTTKFTSTVAEIRSSLDLLSEYRRNGCSHSTVSNCRELFGSLSYCKAWVKDGCGRSECHGNYTLTRLGRC
jgi:hypothetical protein